MATTLLLAAAVVCSALGVRGAEPGCEVDGKTIPVGQQYDIPGECNFNVCKGNNQWTLAACGFLSVPQGWEATGVDTSKPYPDCCGHAKPPLDIVPDVLDEMKKNEGLVITYDGGVKVENGNELTPTQVKNIPQIFYKANPEDHYLLAMVDPDAPSRANPTAREFLHWLTGNIPGNAISSGDTLASYIGSGPPQDTGLHRYVFILFKQPGKIGYTEKYSSAGSRRLFSIRGFAKKYNLEAVSLNVYQAQYDDYVPEVHRQLSKLH